MQDKKFNPLKDQPVFETRKNAAGMMGDKGFAEPGWDTAMVRGGCASLGEAGKLDQITMNLDWTEPEPINFWHKLKDLFGKAKKIDLDFGCLYELEGGKRGVIQAFGEKFGRFDGEPYIRLSGDDRTGETQGEDIRINGQEWGKIRRVLIYAYIYGGVANWSQTNARVLFTMKGVEPLMLKLSHFEDKLPLCAIAKLENIENGMRVTCINEYFPGHAEMDRAFGFGLNWEQGKKDHD